MHAGVFMCMCGVCVWCVVCLCMWCVVGVLCVNAVTHPHTCFADKL